MALKRGLVQAMYSQTKFEEGVAMRQRGGLGLIVCLTVARTNGRFCRLETSSGSQARRLSHWFLPLSVR
jgi:hypothetical protein